MSDVFISYKREDRPVAQRLACALEKTGRTVWWDLELVAGEHFDDSIQRELDAAQCVIVLWSARSVVSRFVKDEATYALTLGKLLPVRIEGVQVPLRFTNLHTLDLTGWADSADEAMLSELVDDVAKRIGPPGSVTAIHSDTHDSSQEGAKVKQAGAPAVHESQSEPCQPLPKAVPQRPPPEPTTGDVIGPLAPPDTTVSPKVLWVGALVAVVFAVLVGLWFLIGTR